MKKQKYKIKLKEYLDLANAAVSKIIAVNKTKDYKKPIMKEIKKQYKKIVLLAKQLQDKCEEPLIRADKIILNELQKYNEFRRARPGILKKLVKNSRNFAKEIEGYMIFNHYNKKGRLQVGKSILAHLLLLSIISAIIATAETETYGQDNSNDQDSEIDYSNLPTTIEQSDNFEKFTAFDPDASKEDAAEEETIEETKSDISDSSASEEIEDAVEPEKIVNTISVAEEAQEEPVDETVDTISAAEETQEEVVDDTIDTISSAEAAEEIQEEPVDETADLRETAPSEEIAEPEYTEPDTSSRVTISDNMLKDYEIYRVKRGDTMWHITRKYYGRFTVRNVCFYIDHLFSPLNDKGYMESYKLGQYDRRNPHLIYPDDELKVPVLTKADPLAIPGDIKDIIGYDEYSDIYTAKGTDGKIIIANFTKRKVAIVSMEDMLVASI